MAISDTSPGIEAMQIKIARSMTVEQRLLLALDAALLCQELMKAGIRNDHPEWSEEQIRHEMYRFVFSPAPVPDWVR